MLQTIEQCIFDDQETAKFLDRHLERFRPFLRRARDELAASTAWQPPGNPLRDGQSVRATVRLEPCALHSIAFRRQMKANPRLPIRASGLTFDDAARIIRACLIRERRCPGSGR